MSERIEELCELAILRLQPGDAIVLLWPGHLSLEGGERLRASVQRALGPQWDRVPVVVLDGGVSLAVARPSNERSPRTGWQLL